MVPTLTMPRGYAAGMVTRIRKGVKPRLFLKEHREAKGVSAVVMAGRLGIERESVHRLERVGRAKAEVQAAWADALGIEPAQLWRPPGQVSLDAIIKDAPEDVKSMAADIVRRLVGKAG